MQLTPPIEIPSMALSFNRSDPTFYNCTRCLRIQIGIRKYMATSFMPYDPTNPDRKLMDSVCQAAAESCSTASQTTWFRSVHASVQYSTMHYEREEVGVKRKKT